MRHFVLIAGLALAGCAPATVNTAPGVDMRGVDGTKYANDLAECRDRARHGGFIQFGAPVSRCLEEKGYRVTERVS